MPQRLRVTYRKGGPARYVAHLDIMRTWERAIRRAQLPLAYTQGFSPHARISLAAPLPVGTEGERELLDVLLVEAVSPEEACSRLAAALPDGLDVVEVAEIGERLPSLQSTMRSGRYEVRFPPGAIEAASLRTSLQRLMALDSLDWEEQRGAKTRRYDLRATIIALAVVERDGVVIEMYLALEEGRTGRPASVLAALGVEQEPQLIVRTALIVDRPSVAMQAWRERGRFEE